MQIVVMIVIAVHALAAVLWMGTTMAIARSNGSGAETLFRPQMGAATLSVLTGGCLWHLIHGGGAGLYEMILAGGALCAIIAAGVQGIGVGSRLHHLKTIDHAPAIRRQIGAMHRIAGALLAICLVCMVVSRFA